MSWKISLREQFGGAGSGNFGHAGRPGEVGGSGDSPSGVFHGTKHEFVKFDENKSAPQDAGIWFHSDEAVARGYGATSNDSSVRVMRANLKINKPFVVTDRDIKITPDKIQELKKQGYDGVKRVLEDEGVEWAVFDNTQIQITGETRETYEQFKKRKN